MKISTQHKQIVQMHPALDFVNNIAYVALKVPNEMRVEVTAIATSECKLCDQAEEWPIQKAAAGLQTIVDDLSLEGPGRWSPESVEAFLSGKLTRCSWQQTYQKIYTAMDQRLVVHDRRYLTVLALFAMMTYFHPLFDALPLLFLRGPAESGKSRAGNVLAAIAFNGKADGYLTEAAIKRRAHEGRYTQILTECDNLAHVGSGDPLARLLHAGCYKNEAWAESAESQSKTKSFVPKRHHIFNPRVLCATLRPKSQPLLSRCIELDLVKVPNADETKLRANLKDIDRELASLRDGMYKLLMLNWPEVVKAQGWLRANGGDIPGRTFDKWLPLATMAKLVSQEVLDEVTELAKESLVAQRHNAGRTFEAIPFQFTRWLVRNGDKLLGEQEIWDALVEPKYDPMAHNRTERRDIAQEKPAWAIITQAPVTIGQLKSWMPTPRQLVHELKRLNLVPQQAKKTNKANKYELRKEHISALVDSYLGNDDEEVGSTESKAVHIEENDPRNHCAPLEALTHEVPAKKNAWQQQLDEWGNELLAPRNRKR